MNSLFLTAQPNYWNKSNQFSGVTLDAYLRVPKSSHNYFPLTPRYIQIGNHPKLQTALLQQANKLSISKSHALLLQQQISFILTIEKRTKQIKIEVKQLFKQWMEWLGPKLRQFKINGEILLKVVKRFIRIYDILKKYPTERQLQIKKNNWDSISQSLRNIFKRLQQSRKDQQNAVEMKELFLQQYSQFYEKSTASDRVIGQVQKLMKQLEDGSGQMGQSEQNINLKRQIKLYESQGLKNSTLEFTKSIKKIGTRKVMFKDGEEQIEDDDEALCQELQLLINKTDEILKKNEKQ